MLKARPNVKLSPQEIVLARHLSEGLSDGEIAEAMNLGEETVKSYLDNMREKTGLRRRTQIAVWWLKQSSRGG
jgi:DNA-binding NarL/FixJ family response regulator